MSEGHTTRARRQSGVALLVTVDDAVAAKLLTGGDIEGAELGAAQSAGLIKADVGAVIDGKLASLAILWSIDDSISTKAGARLEVKSTQVAAAGGEAD